MIEREIYSSAYSILCKEMAVNNNLNCNFNNRKINDSLVYAIRINDSVMIYDSISVDEISEDCIDDLFNSLYKNLNLIHNYQGINIKYFSNWVDDNENHIYDGENEYLNVILSNEKDINDMKRILKAYVKIKGYSNVSAKTKVR